ncbi:MAG: WecB/TagA/CpsF family glycosyltransferase [Opitutaceae bacterium]|nr:WecB/TagA/CpsF family glycosyltransferase [Opitutaceae bacterium]
MPIPTFNVLGVAVRAMNLPTATAAILDAVRARRKGYVCLAAVHGISEAQRDPELKRAYNRALLATTDGMPLVWLAKWHVGGGGIGRVYGPDLMLEVFRATQDGGAAHFLCGGAEGVAELLKQKLLEKFPRARITGTWCPPFREPTGDDEKQLAAAVSAARPDIMWVGLGAPKQELFMARHLGALDTTLMIGVGAAFDFHAGKLRQAPRWMRRCGLEWFFRLCAEPRRLWRRYLVCNPLFIFRTACQLLGLRKYPVL